MVRHGIRALVYGGCGLLAAAALALEPPDRGAVGRYRQDGSYAERVKRAYRYGNHRVRADVAERTLRRMQALAGNQTIHAPLPSWQGMPTTGTNEIVVFLIDFPDHPHVNDGGVIEDKIFGDGVPGDFPRESLRSYYLRSSYGQLTLNGAVLGWYRMQHARDWYTTQYGDGNYANFKIAEEVVSHFDADHDYSVYDNNGDGEVDYFAIIWAGPDNGWANFWWGYQWRLSSLLVRDGVRFADFSWQWESKPVGSAFGAGTIIHETGHALGLPDYYDYDDSVGPDGGVGGLDMMAGVRGDHCAFSKFMLEWLAPAVVNAGGGARTLRALDGHGDAVAVMPGYDGATPYMEYFMVENRHRTGNDTGMPSNGMLVWHIDATPNARGDDFAFDNSYTAHKLLRLMEADGLEEIQTGDGNGDAGDYYNAGERFAPDTMPNSRDYAGNDTGVHVEDISADGATMTADISVQTATIEPSLHASPPSIVHTGSEGEQAPNRPLELWARNGTVDYTVSDDAPWLTVTPDSGTSTGETDTLTLQFDSAALSIGVYESSVTVDAAAAINTPLLLPVTLSVTGTNIAAAVDNTNLVWTTGGAAPWFAQGASYALGGDADGAESGDVADYESSWVETDVLGPGVLEFWWKVSSEPSYDFLTFAIDGVKQPGRLSGNVDWQRVSATVPGGAHTLRWTYDKDFSVSSGLDAGWLDRVSFTGTNVPATLRVEPGSIVTAAPRMQAAPATTLTVANAGGGSIVYTIGDDAAWLTVAPANGASGGEVAEHTVSFAPDLPPGSYAATILVDGGPVIDSPAAVPVSLRVLDAATLGEAVEAPALTWTTGGDAPWMIDGLESYDGIDAVRSGDIEDMQMSWLETAVEGPGALSFWWACDTDEDFDFLTFLVNGQPQGLAITGDEPWVRVARSLPPGRHVLRWEYEKDEYLSVGADAGWLDQVAWAPDEADTDGDGFRDWEEAIAGTGINDSNSLLAVADLSLTTGGLAVIRWSSASNRWYALERAPAAAGTYTRIAAHIDATPPENTFTSTAPAGAAYYRIAAASQPAVIFSESFDSGSRPAGWTVTDGVGDGAVWAFDNPAGRENNTGGNGAFAIADSYFAGEVWMSTRLCSPSLDLSAQRHVSLDFRTDYVPRYGFEAAYVQVAVDGGPWQTAWGSSGTGGVPGPAQVSVDVTALAAGHSNVVFCFFYDDAYDDNWWQIDDVRVLGPQP